MQTVTDGESVASGIVFFSGGTALNETARSLSRYSPSTHVITTFDSGGSSAMLRKHIPIPAVGDIRARLLALASGDAQVAALVRLMNHRLGYDAGGQTQLSELGSLMDGTHPAIDRTLLDWDTGYDAVCRALAYFMKAIPRFDYRGANIGNIMLAALYMRFGSLQAAIDAMGGMLRVKAAVLPVTEELAHLAVSLQNGQVFIGQHTFTGKWEEQIAAPIEDIWLMESIEIGPPVTVRACSHVCSAITSAECICYPIGSFFSSVAANLLVRGVGRAIAQATCPKIFVPNPGTDPELFGLTLREQAEFLIRLLQRDAPGAGAADLLTGVVVDRRGQYMGGIPEAELAELGVRVYYASLLDAKSLRAGHLHIDGEFLAQKLLSFTG